MKYHELKNIGQQCRQLREALGLLQSDVAVDVGVSRETISAFENGRNNSAYLLAWYIEHGLELDPVVSKHWKYIDAGWL